MSGWVMLVPHDPSVRDDEPGEVIAVKPAMERDFSVWRERLRQRMATSLVFVVRAHCGEYFDGLDGGEGVADALAEFVGQGKYVRSTFAYLGWLTGQSESRAAERAAASVELLHCFALLQDDVMDQSATRRGRRSMHLRLADWHQRQGLAGSSQRFGESVAVLLADLCLVWAEQCLRESGLPGETLCRSWPRYDAMRAELAAGQYADLVNDARRGSSVDEMLDVVRRKSGNYTVRRPLELGAALAGCSEWTFWVLGRYGVLIGEAFQFRDDLLGMFGLPEETGKPVGEDLRQRKATSLVVLARELATPTQRARLDQLAAAEQLDDTDVEQWCELLVSTGARETLEQWIQSRVDSATALITSARFGRFASDALAEMAATSAVRTR